MHPKEVLDMAKENGAKLVDLRFMDYDFPDKINRKSIFTSFDKLRMRALRTRRPNPHLEQETMDAFQEARSIAAEAAR